MRKIFLGIAAVVALLIVMAVVVPFLIPADVYKNKVIAAVKSATGRDLVIAGPVSLHILPSLALSAQQVTLSNPAGDVQPVMASIGRLDVGLKLMPLLSHQVVVDHLTLTQPVIHAEVDAAGHPNWQFASAKPAPAIAGNTTRPKTATAQLQQFSLGTVKLVDGTVTYDDRRTGKHQEADKIDVTFSLPAFDQKMSFDGTALWKNQPVSLSFAADNLHSALLTEPTPASLSFDGLGHKLSLKGKLSLGLSLANLSDLTLSLDALNAKGELQLATATSVPSIKGSLAFDALDLNPFLPKVEEPGAAVSPNAAPVVASGADPSGGWSDAPLDFAALKAVDAALAISTGSITYRKIAIGQTALALAIANGKLNADLKQMALYGGSGSGRITIDGSSPEAGIGIDFTAGKVAIEPLLDAAIGMDRLSGTGDISLALAGRGRSQRDMIGTLGGKGALHVVNGDVKGIDLSALIKNTLGTLEKGAGTGETAFSDMGGTFSVANGIMSNNDLTLTSAVIGVTGSGQVNLPQRTLSYRLTPAVVQGASSRIDKMGGLEVPVIVEGPWDHLTYRPDLGAVVQQKLESKVQNLLAKEGGSGKTGNLLKQFLK